MIGRTLVYRVARASSAGRSIAAIRPHPLLSAPRISPLQHRLASSKSGYAEDRAPYKKAESAGSKPFSQFDVSGKVFVVTGAAARPTRSL